MGAQVATAAPSLDPATGAARKLLGSKSLGRHRTVSFGKKKGGKGSSKGRQQTVQFGSGGKGGSKGRQHTVHFGGGSKGGGKDDDKGRRHTVHFGGGKGGGKDKGRRHTVHFGGGKDRDHQGEVIIHFGGGKHNGGHDRWVPRRSPACLPPLLQPPPCCSRCLCCQQRCGEQLPKFGRMCRTQAATNHPSTTCRSPPACATLPAPSCLRRQGRAPQQVTQAQAQPQAQPQARQG